MGKTHFSKSYSKTIFFLHFLPNFCGSNYKEVFWRIFVISEKRRLSKSAAMRQKNAKTDKVTFFRGKKYPHNLGISLSGEDGKFEVHIATTEKFAEKQSYPTDSFRWPNVCLRTQDDA